LICITTVVQECFIHGSSLLTHDLAQSMVPTKAGQDCHRVFWYFLSTYATNVNRQK